MSSRRPFFTDPEPDRAVGFGDAPQPRHVEGADDRVRQGARQARVHPQGHQQPTEATAVFLGGGADCRQSFVLVLG